MKYINLFEQFIAITSELVTEKREDVGKYNTVKKVISELGRRPSEQELASFINNNYYDVTEVERGEDDPAANDKIADLVAFFKFDIDDWQIAWYDAQNESVINEAENYITDEFKVGDKIKTNFGEWEVIETDYAPRKSFIAPFIFKGKDLKRVNIPNPPKTNKNAVGYKVTDGAKYPTIGFLYQYKDITKLATVGVDESVVAEAKGGQIFPGDYVKTQYGDIYLRVDGKVGKSDAYVRVTRGKAGKRKTGLHHSMLLTLVNKDGVEEAYNMEDIYDLIAHHRFNKDFNKLSSKDKEWIENDAKERGFNESLLESDMSNMYYSLMNELYEAKAYKLKASEFGGDTFSAAYNVKGEPTWRVHSTYAIDQVSGENDASERDVVFFEAMPINNDIYIKIGGINNLKRTGSTVGNNFGTTIEEWKNDPEGIAKEASEFLTDATHLKWINKKARSQGQVIKWALKDDYSSVIIDLVNKSLGLSESVATGFTEAKMTKDKLENLIYSLENENDSWHPSSDSKKKSMLDKLKKDLSKFESVVTEAKDMTFVDYLEILDQKFEDAQNAVKGNNGTDAAIEPTRGDILQNFTLFRNYVSSLTKKYKGDKTKLRFITERESVFNETFESVINEASKDRMIKQIERALKDGESIFKLPMQAQEFYRKNKDMFESITEGKIKYAKGKTYQSSGHWTVYVDSNSSGFDIRVNHSAGWRLDPHDEREETLELLDNGRQRATIYFTSGNIDKFAQKMFDLNDRTTDGNQTKLTAKDYADIIRVWIDMKKANESAVTEARNYKDRPDGNHMVKATVCYLKPMTRQRECKAIYFKSKHDALGFKDNVKGFPKGAAVEAIKESKTKYTTDFTSFINEVKNEVNDKQLANLQKDIAKINKNIKVYISTHPVTKGKLSIELGADHDNDDEIDQINSLLKKHTGDWRTGYMFGEALKVTPESDVKIDDYTSDNGEEIKAVEIVGVISSSETEDEFLDYFYNAYGQGAFTETDTATLVKYYNEYVEEITAKETEEEEEAEKAEGGDDDLDMDI